MLRRVLDDDARDPRFIETVATVGYRFLSEVETVEDSSADLVQLPSPDAQLLTGDALRPATVSSLTNERPEVQPSPSPSSPSKFSSRGIWLAGGAAFLVAIAAAAWQLFRPLPLPRATRVTSITNDGFPKGPFVTDGSRLYYSALVARQARFFQVSTQGGEPVPMHPLDGMVPLDISRDHSELLLEGEGGALWVASVLGSAPRRIGDVVAGEASWSPEGDRIAFSSKNELRIARSDGSNPQALLSHLPSSPYGIRWSRRPDNPILHLDRGWSIDLGSLGRRYWSAQGFSSMDRYGPVVWQLESGWKVLHI